MQYQNEKFQIRFKTFTGWTAQIIQHEIGQLGYQFHPELSAENHDVFLKTEP